MTRRKRDYSKCDWRCRSLVYDAIEEKSMNGSDKEEQERADRAMTAFFNRTITPEEFWYYYMLEWGDRLMED